LNTDAPRRHDIDGKPLAVPFLEDCRETLLSWIDEIRGINYATVYNNDWVYVWFNESGHIVFYKDNQGLTYVYEVACPRTDITYLYDNRRSYCGKPLPKASFKSCLIFYAFVVKNSKLSVSHVNRYVGPFGDFCYRYYWNGQFPGRIPTPETYANYRIRPSKFFINTPEGRVFKSPSMSDFRKLKLANSPLVDNGDDMNMDYVYDFWD
jgi:hypothetical protein